MSDADPPAVRVTAGLFSDDVRPAEGEGLSVIVPENPFPLVNRMFAVPGTPADRVRERWSALIPKSTTLTLTVIG